MKKIMYSLISFLSVIFGFQCSQKNYELQPNYPQADSLLMIQHLEKLTKTEEFRNSENVEQLNRTADYIHSIFSKYADTVYMQTYEANGNVYKNVVCRFNSQSDKPLVVVGAHYDVCGDQEGADDNASGVVGLLELARLLKDSVPDYPIEIVAYSLEEPPHFKQETMGSYVHAKSLHDSNTLVYGMLCLEMIGYFTDAEKSQDYPIGIMKLRYGSVGDFILLAKSSSPKEFSKEFSKVFTKFDLIKTETITPPSKSMEIDLSDHINYWKFNYDALMVTNTAFYRNKNYHEQTDTMETLDIGRMRNVINTVYQTLIRM